MINTKKKAQVSTAGRAPWQPPAFPLLLPRLLSAMVGGLGAAAQMGEEEVAILHARASTADVIGICGNSLACTIAQVAMVREVQQYVEKYKSVTYESFEPVEMRTQVVAGTNYFIKVKASAAGPLFRAPGSGHALGRGRPSRALHAS